MGKKIILICSIIEIIFGILGIISAVILRFFGENLTPWVGAIILSFLLIVCGALAIWTLRK